MINGKLLHFRIRILEHENESENLKKNKSLFRSLDLLLIFIITIIAISFILAPNFNEKIIITIFGILLIVFPGYSLVAALYPKKDDLNGIERASLTFGFPLIGLAVGILIININPIAISIPFILLLLATFTVVFIVIAYIRRRKVSENVKYSLNGSKPKSNNLKPIKELSDEETSPEIDTNESQTAKNF